MLFLLNSNDIVGQEKIVIKSKINSSPPSYTDSNTDLKEHWYWSYYINTFGKESIKNDTSITEAYRLLYWGNYFSIIEIIRQDDIYLLTVDSMSWNNTSITLRTKDTLNLIPQISKIYTDCNSLYEVALSKDSIRIITIECEDDRDNWAFEWKNNGKYAMIEGIEVSNVFAKVIDSIMKLGRLSNYEIYKNQEN